MSNLQFKASTQKVVPSKTKKERSRQKRPLHKMPSQLCLGSNTLFVTFLITLEKLFFPKKEGSQLWSEHSKHNCLQVYSSNKANVSDLSQVQCLLKKICLIRIKSNIYWRKFVSFESSQIFIEVILAKMRRKLSKQGCFKLTIFQNKMLVDVW